MKTATAFTFLSLALCYASVVHADTFGSGSNLFDIEFVTIGDPNNPADTTGSPNPAGSVPYNYGIGKFEISEDMIDKANELGNLGLTHDGFGPNRPASSISWFEAVKFVNWLNTSTGSTPAYKFDGSGNFQLWQSGDAGYNPANLYRNNQAHYFLPSVDEWYKAAYYDPTSGNYFDFPTGSDTAPIPVVSGTASGTAVYNRLSTGPAVITLAGGLSPYGTMGQGGNVFEWEETEADLVNDSTSSNRGLRGGDWSNFLPKNMAASARTFVFPGFQDRDLGFRVASIIPEPLILALVDIKPGSVPNSVNLKSKGVLPVAILGTGDFDVSDVDIDTLLFGDPLLLDDGGTAVSPLRNALGDVSGDGILDLTLKFSTRDLVVFGALGSDTIEGRLTGALLDGTPFEGMDSIRIVPPNGSNGNDLQISSVPEPTTWTLALAALCLAMSSQRCF